VAGFLGDVAYHELGKSTLLLDLWAGALAIGIGALVAVEIAARRSAGKPPESR